LNAKAVKVELLDLSGHVVKSLDINRGYGSQVELDVRDVKAGIYLLHFYDEEGRSSERLITYKVIIAH
jgi:hypothetical protein